MFTHTVKQMHSSANGTCISVEHDDLQGYLCTGSLEKQVLEKNGREVTSSDKATHRLCKQLFFGDVLISPLYPASLANALFERVRLELFGEAAKDARKQKRNNKPCDIPVYQFKNLGSIKCGGANPVNVGELAKKQRGIYYYLPALPPRTPLPKRVYNDFMRRIKDVPDNTTSLYIQETNEWLHADFIRAPEVMRHPVMIALGERVRKEKGTLCYYCGLDCENDFNLAHIMCRKFFWWEAFNFDNLAAAHSRCNKKAGNSIGMMGEPICIM